MVIWWLLFVFSIQERLHPLKLCVWFEEDALGEFIDGRVRGPWRVEDTFGEPDGEWILGSDPCRECEGCEDQLVWFIQFSDEPNSQRLCAVEYFPGEQYFLRQGLAHEFHEAPACAGGSEDADPCFGVADLCPRRGNPEVRRIGQFSTAAERKAVNGCNHRHGQLGDSLEEAGVDSHQGIITAAFAELGDIRPGRKDAAGGNLRSGDDKDSGLPLQIRTNGVQLAFAAQSLACINA